MPQPASSSRSFSTTTQGGPSSAQGRQSTLFTSCHPQQKAQVDAAVARFFYSCGISFNVARSEFFKEMVSEIANFGPTYQPPSYDALREKLLEEEISSITKAIIPIKQKWSAYGVSLVADGWTDGRSRSLEGLLAACRGKTLYIKFRVGVVTWWEDYGADPPASKFGHQDTKPYEIRISRDLYIGFHKNEQDPGIWEGIFDEEENEADEELVHEEVVDEEEGEESEHEAST
ncbi:hypothetical protein L7F22_018136 [Adiantum nelumboides]|nr:hypothetical protein [Adiantum nelumboides]